MHEPETKARGFADAAGSPESAAQVTSAEPTVVAVDVGGTDLKVGLVTAAPAGVVLSDVGTVPTPVASGPDAVLGAIVDQIAALRTPSVAGFGVAVPGIVADGVARRATNIGWRDLPLQAELTARIGLPGVVDHDVRCAGLAEWRLGRDRDVTDFLFVALGTGISAAVVVDGHMLVAQGYAGELGHISVAAAHGRPCGCGRRGCLETVSSARGVRSSYAEPHHIPVAAAPTTADIAALARAGDPPAVAAFARAVDGLAEALVVAVTLYGSEVVMLGGGLSGAADLLVPTLERRLLAELTFQRRPRLAVASFGAQAGLVGAGLAGLQNLQELVCD